MSCLLIFILISPVFADAVEFGVKKGESFQWKHSSVYASNGSKLTNFPIPIWATYDSDNIDQGDGTIVHRDYSVQHNLYPNQTLRVKILDIPAKIDIQDFVAGQRNL